MATYINPTDMAISGYHGGKTVRISIRNWFWFSSVGVFGVLFALESYQLTHQTKGFREQRNQAFSNLGVKFNVMLNARGSQPSGINCEEEVGVAVRKFIPSEQHYHPLSSMISEESLHNRTCKSKYQQHCYWKSKHTPSPSFLEALRTYESHHKKCTEGVPLTELALQGSASSGCQYIIFEDLDGKGNQLISLVSAFVYALLTNRVLLINREAGIQNLLCEPFPRSSWVLPEDFPEKRIREESEIHGFFYDRALNYSTMGQEDVFLNSIPKHLDALLSNMQRPADLRFFCEGEQKLLGKVPWVFFRSNQYSIPGFYFLPSFRTKLDALFPDRAVFLHAGRYLLSPEDHIWTRIMRIYGSHMAAADRRLGIQIRAWGNKYEPIVSDHILSCVLYSGALPGNVSSRHPSGSSSSNGSSDRPGSNEIILGTRRSSQDQSWDGERIAVVLVSLRKEYAETLASQFQGVRAGNSKVTIFSPSAEEEQKTGLLVHERTVIADMWLLSFADDVISTPKSTFGFVAHGLAGITPIVLYRFSVDKEVPDPPCWRTNLPGPCFIDYPYYMECPLDGPNATISDGQTFRPEVQPCELQWGVGIVEGVLNATLVDNH